MFNTAVQARQSMSYKHLQFFSLVYIIIIIIIHTVYASRSFSVCLSYDVMAGGARPLVYFQFLQQEHHRDYVLFTELHRCVSDIMRQIQLDKDNEKEIGTSIEPEKYRKLYNLFGTDTHHKHTEAMRITRGEEELQV